MSSSIWTRCGRRTERLQAQPWRAVEDQHLAATRGLVDSAAEHELLEALLEASKPPRPAGRRAAGLHVLLATPFRYPPLRHGSRFGTRAERGIWYGSDSVEGALAEVAYYRLLFLEGTEARLAPLVLPLSLFQAQVDAPRGANLSRPPFDRYRDRVSSPVDWGESQRLGAEARADGVQALRYFSARDPAGGTNLAVLDPEAFARRAPSREQRWRCAVTPEAVELRRDELLDRRRLAFPRTAFLVDGRLPRPGV